MGVRLLFFLAQDTLLHRDVALKRTLLRVAFARWNVEHEIRLGKSERGFRHFEGRADVGLMRHLVLCLLPMTFVAGQPARLRGEPFKALQRKVRKLGLEVIDKRPTEAASTDRLAVPNLP
jgi:hypothetical protein